MFGATFSGHPHLARGMRGIPPEWGGALLGSQGAIFFPGLFPLSLYFGICMCWGGLHGNQTPTACSVAGDVPLPPPPPLPTPLSVRIRFDPGLSLEKAA